ncbi:MAG TPA: NDP-sugar synthase, partial [Corynebacterium sp.]|nr:NDP-sugar synthase [Corynebacterium sp.]
FEGVTIEPGATIKDSIISAGSRIGANARIVDCVIGEGVQIGARCELQGGIRIWPGVIIPDNGVRFSSDA